MKRVLAIIALVALTGCADDTLFQKDQDAPEDPAPASEGYVFDEPTPKPPEDVPPAPQPRPVQPDATAGARAACADDGGSLTRTPTGAFVCVHRTRDAGKTCTAPSQCQGQCLAKSGTCAPVTPLVGCHDVITRAGMATLCLD